MKFSRYFILILAVLTLCHCTENKELGSKQNPLKFYLVPAQDMQGLAENGKVLEAYLKKDLGMEVVVELPVSYIAVVEAFGSKRADVAILNTFGYILANEKYGVEAHMKLMNRGRDEYWGEIIARVDGPKTIKDLNGKKFAFVDPASTSGYLLPQRLFKQEGIKIKEHIFAGRHDTVVAAVYQRQVDAGAAFYTFPDDDGTIKDARMLVKAQFPDVFEKIKILQLTGPIPNDPISIRKDLPEDLKKKICDSLLRYIRSPEGKETMFKLYHITDFKPASDKDYDKVRGYLKDLGKTAQEFME